MRSTFPLALLASALVGCGGSTQSFGSGGSGGAGSWSEAVPPNTAGNIFFDGAELTLGSRWPGGIQSVTWSADFAANQPGVSVSWQWGAAVYTKFGAYASLGVKPVDDNHASAYMSSDHAGTPESFKAYVTCGARGGGGSNFTGSYSGTLGFPVCPSD